MLLSCALLKKRCKIFPSIALFLTFFSDVCQLCSFQYRKLLPFLACFCLDRYNNRADTRLPQEFATLLGSIIVRLVFRTHRQVHFMAKNKPKHKHRNEARSKKWHIINTRFRELNISNISSLHPPSDQNLHCFSVFDAFSQFLLVYAITNTGSQPKVSAVEKRIHCFKNHWFCPNDRSTASLTSLAAQKNWD